MYLYCDLCGNQFDTDNMVYVHCGSYICNGCILSEARKLTVDDKGITIDWLKENHYDAYFFGLGFIQVKINEQNRIHFYHPDLPAFVDNPHDHRYNFTSQVLRGTLKTKIWEECPADSPGAFDATIEFASCQRDGSEIKVPDSLNVKAEFVGEFSTSAGSSYYMNQFSFHAVEPEFDNGPCVTYITRGPVQKNFARILRVPGDKNECPFSQPIEKDKLWQIVDQCLST